MPSSEKLRIGYYEIRLDIYLLWRELYCLIQACRMTTPS
jgi:hypothetical protein